ncbi:MAG: SRPBCC family protein, partial [Nakamurella sp.]
INETVNVDKPTGMVFDYLADFTTSTQWDPGTVKTIRVEGNGGVGTRYENTSKFAGRVNTVIYVVQEVIPGKHIHLRGENSSLVANDRITVEPQGSGSTVTYRAEFDFQGILKVLTPILSILVKRLGKEGALGMKQALDQL